MEEGKETEKEATMEAAIIEEKITKANGETVIKKYSKGKALGRGGFAKCYEVTNL
jgi:polo-like kinase 1